MANTYFVANVSTVVNNTGELRPVFEQAILADSPQEAAIKWGIALARTGGAPSILIGDYDPAGEPIVKLSVPIQVFCNDGSDAINFSLSFNIAVE